MTHICIIKIMEIFIQENAFEQSYHTDFKTKWHHITDNFSKFIFLDKDCWTLIQIWLKLVPKGPIGIKPALVQIMAWWWTAEKPLTESVMSYVTDTKMCHLVLMSQNTLKSEETWLFTVNNSFKYFWGFFYRKCILIFISVQFNPYWIQSTVG